MIKSDELAELLKSWDIVPIRKAEDIHQGSVRRVITEAGFGAGRGQDGGPVASRDVARKYSLTTQKQRQHRRQSLCFFQQIVLFLI